MEERWFTATTTANGGCNLCADTVLKSGGGGVVFKAAGDTEEA